jgi:DNA replication regulator SLD3
MKDLVFFLESLILSTTQLDKKYKDGVPILVSILDIEGNSEGGENPKSKKRKNMKMKPGKNGLYPTEPDFIRKWWESHDDDGASGLPGDSLEDVARRRIADLRIRETQLQMIVVLETLALQPLATSSECQDGELPGGKDMTFGSTKPSVKPKKSKDLTALVDVHVDRLCIWQSVAAEGQSTKSASVLQTSETTDSNKHAADVLREFCVEVVVPL